MRMCNGGSFFNSEQLYALGLEMARRYVPDSITRTMICELYKATIPIPVIIRRGGTTLWIDKYYAAVETEECPLTYVYLTRSHIYEEEHGYLEAAKARENDNLKLPWNIAHQFRYANKQMRKYGTKIWLHDSYKAIMEVA